MMFNPIEQKISEEKIDWQEKVKREFPYDWPKCLAAIQTAEEIIGTEEQRWVINWKKVYQACQVSKINIFSSLYNREEVANINQCYRQFIRGEKPALEKIYYFSNDEPNHILLSQLLARLENTNCKLISLSFKYNRINDVGAKEIAIALKSEHCKLTSLNLWHNQIDAAGAALIAEALKSEHCKLTSLNLWDNQIGVAGAKEIATALKSKHCKLISLNLRCNRIDDAGTKEIAIALKSEHCRLTSLELANNQIGTEGAREIVKALTSEHCKLTSLNLECNRIDAAGAKEIADALKSKHCKLMSLDLWGNQIVAAGAKEIANTLKSGHCKLTSLDLRENRINEAGKLAIALALKHPHCPCDLHIELDSDVEKYILEFNKEWHQAQELYTLLSHPDGNSQYLSVLPPYVTIKGLFPYLFDIFKDELKPVTEQKLVEIPTYEYDEQGKIKTKDGKPIVTKSTWELRDVSTGELDEAQSQVGNCFLDNHFEYFKIIQSQRQDTSKSYEEKSSGQIDQKNLSQSCNLRF